MVFTSMIKLIINHFTGHILDGLTGEDITNKFTYLDQLILLSLETHDQLSLFEILERVQKRRLINKSTLGKKDYSEESIKVRLSTIRRVLGYKQSIICDSGKYFFNKEIVKLYY